MTESLEAMLERHRNEIGATREPWINLVTRHHNESVEWYKNARGDYPTYTPTIHGGIKFDVDNSALLDQAALAILQGRVNTLSTGWTSMESIWEMARKFVEAREK